MRILSYNVRYFGHATRGIASTGTAMRRIADALAGLTDLPDIACLQEVETMSIRSTVAHPQANPEETQLERFMAMLRGALRAHGRDDAYDAHYFPAHVYRLAKGVHIYTTGLAILTHRGRVVIDRHNSKGPHDITHRGLNAVRSLKQTRICAHVRFSHTSGQTIDVFNTHLSLPSALTRHFWTGQARMGYGPNQLEEAKNLAQFVATERASDRFLLVGDFNSLPGSPVYRYLTRECSFRDPFAQIHRMSEDELRAFPTAGFMNLRMHLDHVFCGPGLRWDDFDDTHAFGDRTTRFHGLSDHAPLIGRCRVAGARGDSVRPPLLRGA